MNTLVLFLYISESVGERAFVGFLTGLATALLLGIISWVSRKKQVKAEQTQHEVAKAELFANSQDKAYHRLLIDELKQICNPENYMKPYVYEKVCIANELYSILQNNDLSDDVVLEVRKRAESELGAQLPTGALYSLLVTACNPAKFMSPYNKEKVARANYLYNEVLKNQNSLSELEKIGAIAREEGFLELWKPAEKKTSSNDEKETSVSESEKEDNQQQIIGEWINPKGNYIRLTETEDAQLFSLEICDENGWHQQSSLRQTQRARGYNGMGATFVDAGDSGDNLVYKISQWDTSLMIIKDEVVIEKYQPSSKMKSGMKAHIYI